jgi:uncharacterized membrane protein
METHMTARAMIVAVAVAAAGCGGGQTGPTGSTCPTASTLTYQSFGQSFMKSYCTRCHASTLSGPARHDAPLGQDFDTQAGVQRSLADIDRTAAAGPKGTNTSMPQGSPSPSDAERKQLGEWIACGAP